MSTAETIDAIRQIAFTREDLENLDRIVDALGGLANIVSVGGVGNNVDRYDIAGVMKIIADRGQDFRFEIHDRFLGRK
jgi:hypothetical protein